MLLDSVDQSIFQQFPAIPLEGYQSYDKSLDIYYLAIIYMATMRNWTNAVRLQDELLPLLLPARGSRGLRAQPGPRTSCWSSPTHSSTSSSSTTPCASRWNPTRLSRKAWRRSAAAIWIFIKLPQEWWIHVAKLDVTDAIKTTIFGVGPKTPPGARPSRPKPWVPVAIIAGFAALGFLVYWIITRKAPKFDHGPRWTADPLPPECRGAELYRTVAATEKFFDRALLEKVVLTGLDQRDLRAVPAAGEGAARAVEVFAYVAVFIVVNAFVSQVMARRGRSWNSVLLEGVVMYVVNLVIATVLASVLRLLDLGLGTTVAGRASSSPSCSP